MALTLIAVIAVIVNPSAWWALAAGVGVAIILATIGLWWPMLRARRSTWIPLAIVAVIFGLITVTISPNVFFTVSPVEYWATDVHVIATYDGEGQSLNVRTQMIIPTSSLEAATKDLGARRDDDAEAKPTTTGSDVEEQQSLLLDALARSGWQLDYRENGQLVAIRSREEAVPAHVAIYPFTTPLTIELPVVKLMGSRVILYAGEGSELEVIGPDNFISSSRPPGHRDDIPAGERYVVPLNGNGVMSEVELAATSPVVRADALTWLARLSVSDALVWVVLLLAGVAVAFTRDRLAKFLEWVFRGRKKLANQRSGTTPDRTTRII